jgi:hypothetical protein
VVDTIVCVVVVVLIVAVAVAVAVESIKRRLVSSQLFSLQLERVLEQLDLGF